ncbi:MAG TPA: hypothetical protein VIT64_11070, partial [Ilumatobacteraceae bacterium]
GEEREMVELDGQEDHPQNEPCNSHARTFFQRKITPSDDRWGLLTERSAPMHGGPMRTLGIVALVAATTMGCTSGSDPGVRATNAAGADLTAPDSDTDAASGTAGATAGAAVSGVFGSGTYIVGTDIQPGTYRVFGYWARLDGERAVIDADAVYENGVGLMNVVPTDSFVEITGAAHPLASSGILDPVADGFTVGTYLVNWDIQPGRYRLSAISGSSYYALLDATGSIIRSNATDGDTIVIVAVTDWALTFEGVMTRA